MTSTPRCMSKKLSILSYEPLYLYSTHVCSYFDSPYQNLKKNSFRHVFHIYKLRNIILHRKLMTFLLRKVTNVAKEAQLFVASLFFYSIQNLHKALLRPLFKKSSIELYIDIQRICNRLKTHMQNRIPEVMFQYREFIRDDGSTNAYLTSRTDNPADFLTSLKPGSKPFPVLLNKLVPKVSK